MREDIHDLVFKEITPKYLDLSNLSDAGVLKGILEIVAELASVIKDHQDEVKKNAYISSASGMALDYLVGQVDIKRFYATKTTGKIIFGRNGKTDQAVKIPKGTIVKTKLTSLGKEFRYITTETVILPEKINEILVEIEAENFGIEYNVPSSYISRIVTPISGIDYINNKENWIRKAGTNEEDDEKLRSRYYARWGELITGSNGKSYESWARRVPDVIDVQVISLPRGYNTVDVIISTDIGVASEVVIDKVKTIINNEKPIGVDVIVYSPISVEIEMELTLHLFPSFSVQQEQIKQKTIEIINAVFVKSISSITPFKPGEDFVPDKIKHFLFGHIEGIKYIDIYPNEIRNITKYQICTKGNIDISVVIEEEP